MNKNIEFRAIYVRMLSAFSCLSTPRQPILDIHILLESALLTLSTHVIAFVVRFDVIVSILFEKSVFLAHICSIMTDTTDVDEESTLDPDAVPLNFLDDEQIQPTKKQKIPADLECKVEEEQEEQEETVPPLEIAKPIPLPDTVDVPIAAAVSKPKQTKNKENKSKNYPAVVYKYRYNDKISFPFLEKKDPRDVHLFCLLNLIGGEKEGEGLRIP